MKFPIYPSSLTVLLNERGATGRTTDKEQQEIFFLVLQEVANNICRGIFLIYILFSRRNRVTVVSLHTGSPCVNPNAHLPYTTIPSTPGQLLQVATPGTLPPAEAPAPILDPADIVDPPLPPVVAVADQAPPVPAPATSAPNKSGQPANMAGVLLCLIMAAFSFVQLRV